MSDALPPVEEGGPVRTFLLDDRGTRVLLDSEPGVGLAIRTQVASFAVKHPPGPG